ncbi:MAG: hypothetical protein C4518_16480 [Desulfobacteraceae bacterium]|nr:MAG: hypothetical protein C4518_16480 [Desulfobacteraceae bacterium]
MLLTEYAISVCFQSDSGLNPFIIKMDHHRMNSITTDTDVFSRASRLISSCHAMTLATADDITPWAAPVYYANIKSFFYFFSNPDARHIQNALAAGSAACAIYAEGGSWQDLQGIQMSGKITPATQADQAAKAVIEYVKKFPLVKTFFPTIKNLTLNSFIKRFHASLYCFQPDYIVYMDNTVDFGFRQEIPVDALT